MFGYVRVRRAELRVREYEYYRAVYCGLCRSMGECTGQCSRLTLNYDIAFLTHLRLLLTGTKPVFRSRRCMAHPLRRRTVMEGNEQLDYCAKASAILAFEKCQDDLADEKLWGRILAALRMLFLKKAYKRARKSLPLLAERVRSLLTELSALEKEVPASVDAPAAIFGQLLAEIAAEGLPLEMQKIAGVIGDKTGRFIYIIDAIDDLEQDAEKGNYNPILQLYGSTPTREDKESIRAALLACLADLEAALDLAPPGAVPETLAVLKNILYLGMPDAADRVLCADDKISEEKKSESEPL